MCVYTCTRLHRTLAASSGVVVVALRVSARSAKANFAVSRKLTHDKRDIWSVPVRRTGTERSLQLSWKRCSSRPNDQALSGSVKRALSGLIGRGGTRDVFGIRKTVSISRACRDDNRAFFLNGALHRSRDVHTKRWTAYVRDWNMAFRNGRAN